jgi:AcrR family transcriptional regulator
MPKSRESPASPRAYGGESHTDRVTARHERLLEAGLELIGTEGRSAATVRAVCATSGLSQRYYYESFRDAEDLLTQVYQRQIARLEAAILGSVQPDLPLQQQVRRAADAYFSTIRADPRLGRVVLFEVLGVSPAVDALHRAGSQRFEGVVSALITSGLPQTQSAGARPRRALPGRRRRHGHRGRELVAQRLRPEAGGHRGERRVRVRRGPREALTLTPPSRGGQPCKRATSILGSRGLERRHRGRELVHPRGRVQEPGAERGVGLRLLHQRLVH